MHRLLLSRQHLTAHQSPDNHPGSDSTVLLQYKDLIREQDQRINEISQANLYLQQELATARQQAEELASSVQALQDQNALLRYSPTALLIDRHLK
jgi:hypothetical protein